MCGVRCQSARGCGSTLRRPQEHRHLDHFVCFGPIWHPPQIWYKKLNITCNQEQWSMKLNQWLSDAMCQRANVMAATDHWRPALRRGTGPCWSIAPPASPPLASRCHVHWKLLSSHHIGWLINGYGSIPMKIPFLVGWTSIYQLFWCELQGYKVLTHCQMMLINDAGANNYYKWYRRRPIFPKRTLKPRD